MSKKQNKSIRKHKIECGIRSVTRISTHIQRNMNIGGSPRKSKRLHSPEYTPPTVKRQRRPIINQVDIGGQSTRFVSDDVVQRVINREIPVNIPTVVSLPIPPARHAFLVNIQTDYKKIMIAEWVDRTEEMVELGKHLDEIEKLHAKFTRTKVENNKLKKLESITKNWKQYLKFMDLLQ